MTNNDDAIPKKPFPGEIVLEILAEGGRICILRVKADDKSYKFIMTTDESIMADFLDEGDVVNLVHRYPAVETFEEALLQMDKYPWEEFTIEKVLPDYLEVIETEKRKRLTHSRR